MLKHNAVKVCWKVTNVIHPEVNTSVKMPFYSSIATTLKKKKKKLNTLIIS